MGKTIPVERACGRRALGAAYLECGFSPYGRPVEHFIQCPPAPLDTEALGITDIGVHPLQDPKTDIWHAVNIVGMRHWPNVADYIEETKRFGLSARVQRTFPFHLLSEGSRILSAHRRAIITDPAPYYTAIAEETCFALDNDRPEIASPFCCPKHKEEHEPVPADTDQMCAGLWWEDVEKGTLVLDPTVPPRTVERVMPAFRYTARKRPMDKAPAYQTGIFLSLPIQNIAVIADWQGGRDQKAIEAVQRALLPWSIEVE